SGGVHEVDVLDQGSTQGAGNRLSPAVGHETSPDLLLDVGLETLETLCHVLLDQALLEGGQLTVAHEHLDERPLQCREVETSQGSIEVIGPADRSPGLHAGQMLDGLGGGTPQALVVEL